MFKKLIEDDMETKREKKREDLRNRLIDAAEATISEKGLRGLKARDVTAKAGCALGALYNAVEDLDQLIMLVNSRTLAKLGNALKQAIPKNASPTDTMQSLAGAYVAFALEQTQLWSAVFNHKLSEDTVVPDWHTAEYPVLISEIIAPLSKLRPDLEPDALTLRAQTIFASVHGVVQLAIHGRFVGTPLSLLASEVAALVDAMTRGIHLVSK
ncbi:MAG: AcrR family transcriptional regulator [Candidatus Azotimanducaceae bacterium]